MRWKAHFFDNPNTVNSDHNNNYGFNSKRTPPQNNALIPFENDLYDMINSITFIKHKSSFQKQLDKDVKSIQSSPDIFVPADKTTNIYKVSPEVYKKLLHDNITASYEKTTPLKKHEIDSEAKTIAEPLKLDDRIECLAEREAFITLKDHKDNFNTTPKCRLLNPAKSEIGKVSKIHLQNINEDVRKSLALNQWRNTATVINWFNNIQQKSQHRFLQLDIVEFYPSITENLLTRALTFAETLTPIHADTIGIIKHCRKSLLFAENSTWVKKNDNLFDVTMGSHDGAEICEMVGLYLLHEITQKFPFINFGLYRDDGLGCHKSIPGPALERTKKQIIELFKANGLRITIDTNMQQVNFLDVTLDLAKGKHWPFRKPNDKPLYIHRESNHPPNIKKELPEMIQSRLSHLSSDKTEFDKAKQDYETALSNSGFKEKLIYKQTEKPKRARTRNIIYFNPPYNAAVSTNIGHQFLSLIKKHFPKHH